MSAAKHTPDETALPELDALFQPRQRPTRAVLRSVAILPGESYEQAVQRQDAAISRIKAANAKATGGAS